jgi:hypothetical protein
MAGEVRREERSYRRGLVMGLTMAEILVLVVFCLLLLMGRTVAVAVVGRNHEKELDDLRGALAEASGRTVASPISNDFLELVKTGRHAYERMTAAGLAEPSKSVDDVVQVGLEVSKALGANTMNKSEASAAKEFVNAAAAAYNRAQKTAPYGSAAIWLENLIKCAGTCGGNGLVYPPCAKNPDGTAALIFTTTLRSGSITIHDNRIPSLETERQSWPTEAIRFEEPLSREAFLEQTLPMFEWSVARACRFVVDVKDETEASEKMVYKTRLRTVEQHFYKREQLQQ